LLAVLIASSLDPELSPGDVFPAGWDADRTDIGPVVVCSHGCDIDKSSTVLVAEFTPADTMDPGMLGNARSRRVWHLFYLNEPPIEGCVNFRKVFTVPKARLLERMESRDASMTDDGRMELATRFFSFLTRTLPPTPPTTTP
jgi:hypothetical protein